MMRCLSGGILAMLAFHGLAAPITFNTALPVASGEFVARVLFRTGESKRDTGRKMNVEGFTGVLGYGINQDLTLFAVVPWIDKRLDVNGAGRQADGFADSAMFARYTVFKRNLPGQTLRLAPFAGVKLANGSDDENDRIGTVPPGLQPGTGTTGWFGGMVLTWQKLAWELDTQIRVDSFRDNGGQSGDIDVGNRYAWSSSFQYRIWPGKLDSTTPGFLYLVLESELSHQRRTRVSGVPDTDSGGDRFVLSPGIQYVTRRWVAELSVQIPVVQDLNGAALENRYGVSGGFRWNF